MFGFLRARAGSRDGPQTSYHPLAVSMQERTTDDSWIPDEFKEAMKDAEAGRLVDLETALRETPPPHLGLRMVRRSFR